MDQTHLKSDGVVLLTRNDLPDTYGPQSYTFTLVATTPEGTASVPITATLPAPRRTARYPTTSSGLPLAQQRARQQGKWITDQFPPQSFDFYGSFQGRDNVRFYIHTFFYYFYY